jgi:hypothetical protein
MLLFTGARLTGEKATVWSFNFFFYNKKMKRMMYLSCRAVSKLSADKEVRACCACPAVPALRQPWLPAAADAPAAAAQPALGAHPAMWALWRMAA